MPNRRPKAQASSNFRDFRGLVETPQIIRRSSVCSSIIRRDIEAYTTLSADLADAASRSSLRIRATIAPANHSAASFMSEPRQAKNPLVVAGIVDSEIIEATTLNVVGTRPVVSLRS
jgi:hypothetical protein